MSYPQYQNSHPTGIPSEQLPTKSGYQPPQYSQQVQQNGSYPLPVQHQPPLIPTQVSQTYQPQPYQNALIPQEYIQKMQKRKTATIAMVTVGAVVLSLILGLAALMGGSITFFLALIPLSLVVAATFWIGKWDPEPGFMRILAFVWGTVGSVILTMLITYFIIEPIWPSTTMTGAVIHAPFVEEFCKGMFVLFIALFFKKYMNSPVDGVVYILLVAAGFAFTENILYFTQSLAIGGTAALSQTFVLRGVLSPFAHSLFSLPMGILLGLAIRKHYSFGKIMVMFAAGYVPAVMLHALWNGSSFFIEDSNLWFLFYGLVQLPLFVGAIYVVVWLRQQESLRTYKYLTAYAHKGWFTPLEVETFASFAGRKHIMKWAKSKTNPQAIYLVKKINKEIVDLTMVREDIVLYQNKHNSVEKQQVLLQQITHDKELLSKF